MNYGNHSTTATPWTVYTTSDLFPTTTIEPFRTKTRLTVGVALAVSGNILISVAMNVQKYSHNRLIDTGQSYLKSTTWWCGLVLMGLGEVGNFTAYGFAPASLVAPLGTTAVISNVIIASVFLKEKFDRRNATGITFAIIGAFLLVRFSNKRDTMLTAHEIINNFKSYGFIIYLIVEILAFIFIMFLHHRLNYVKVVTILLQVALLGSLTVISAKAVSSMISISFSGLSQLVHPIFYIMVAVMIVSAIGQIKFLNQAMASFDATVVMPINFVFFTLSAILSGIAFYQEFFGLTPLQISMFLLGTLLSFGGVFFITGGRLEQTDNDNENISLLNSRTSVVADLRSLPTDSRQTSPAFDKENRDM